MKIIKRKEEKKNRKIHKNIKITGINDSVVFVYNEYDKRQRFFIVCSFLKKKKNTKIPSPTFISNSFVI